MIGFLIGNMESADSSNPLINTLVMFTYFIASMRVQIQSEIQTTGQHALSPPKAEVMISFVNNY